MEDDKNIPTAFISYSWDSEVHKTWVHDLAARLRKDGVEVTLDQWHLLPGDQLPEFMERAVRDSDYVLIVCTKKYKTRSDQRAGGVGYEGDIMAGEVMNNRNQRKFVPLLREGLWENSAPSWLLGKYYINLTGNPYSEPSYNDLITTLFGTRPGAPPVGKKAAAKTRSLDRPDTSSSPPNRTFDPIRITGIVLDEIGEPRNDGTRGSALYRVPFKLSRRPPRDWAAIFVQTWDSPPRFTTMHRPGIASVIGDTVVLDGTTVKEVERHHRDTLVLATNEANRKYVEFLEKKRAEEERKQKRSDEHKKNVEDIAQRLSFDETDYSD